MFYCLICYNVLLSCNKHDTFTRGYQTRVLMFDLWRPKKIEKWKVTFVNAKKNRKMKSEIQANPEILIKIEAFLSLLGYYSEC